MLRVASAVGLGDWGRWQAMGWRRWSVRSTTRRARRRRNRTRCSLLFTSIARRHRSTQGWRGRYLQLPTCATATRWWWGASNSGSAEVARPIAFAAAEHQRVYVERLCRSGADPRRDLTSPFFDSADHLGEMTVIDGGSLEPALVLPKLPQPPGRSSSWSCSTGTRRQRAYRGSFARSAGVPISTVLTRRKFCPAARPGEPDTPSKPTPTRDVDRRAVQRPVGSRIIT